MAIHGDDESRKRILSKTAFKQPIQVLTDGKQIAIIGPHAAAARDLQWTDICKSDLIGLPPSVVTGQYAMSFFRRRNYRQASANLTKAGIRKIARAWNAVHGLNGGGKRRAVTTRNLTDLLTLDGRMLRDVLSVQSAKIFLVRNRLAPPDRLKEWMLHEVQPRTVVSPVRLEHVYRVAGNPDLPAGAFVECGVGPGGCVAAMAYAGGTKRKVWGFDSFEGMPPLTSEDEGDGQEWVGFKCSWRGLEDAQQTVDHFRLSNVTLVKGWFEDTLPPHRERIGQIAVLRLDNDWYKSTRFCLHQLYDQVVVGGCIIIDDYHTFLGCRKAVDEFRSERNISTAMVTTESNSEAWWVREN